jgi:hypothetical protein
MRYRMVRTVASLSFLVLTGVACGGDSGGVTDTRTEPTTFESTGGRFSAEFPGEPREEVETTTAEGINLEIHFFTNESSDFAVSVGYVDYPEEFKTLDPAQILSGVAGGAAGNIAGGRVTRSEPGTFQGVPSVDYEVTADEANLQAKAFLIENRLYLLQAVSEDMADADAEYDRLVETFKLI